MIALGFSYVIEHGGRLTFDTSVGAGTTFHIRLPIAGHPADAADAAPAASDLSTRSLAPAA